MAFAVVGEEVVQHLEGKRSLDSLKACGEQLHLQHLKVQRLGTWTKTRPNPDGMHPGPIDQHDQWIPSVVGALGVIVVIDDIGTVPFLFR
jgi:hypothetical protein